jgi:class 3 adenylate cyclase
VIAHTGVCPVRIGREREVAAIAESLDEVRSTGQGRLLLVAGEAGVGKSRLAAEAQRLAEADGLTRLEGHCTSDAGVPYAPFVQAVRRRTRTLDRAALNELFDGSAVLAAALLPEVAREVGLPQTDPSNDDLYAAVWQLLSRLARPRAGLLLIEDLHWADPDSLRLLGYLAGELADLPVLVLGTYRSDEMHRRHPLHELLTTLGRERRYQELALAPLDREQLRSMLSAIFDGTDVGDEFTDVVLDRTDGNPFFVEELAKVLVDNGDVYWQGDDWVRRDLVDIELPESVRETLLARARSLDATSLRVLQLAALAGDHLDPDVLAAAADVDSAQVDDAVRDGLRLQLLAERRDSAGGATRYAFRHALTREAFADELVGPDRRRGHRALAAALSDAYADDPDAVAAELADHYAAADDPERAYAWCLRAARAAAACFARDEADERFDQALRMRQGTDSERLGVLLEAARVVGGVDVSRMQVAFANEARSLAQALADPVSEARALLVLENDGWLAGDGAAALRSVHEAAALVHGHDDYVEAQVLRRLTRALALSDRDAEVEELLPGAIELATRSGNLSALSGMHGTRMLITREPGAMFEQAFAAALDAARAAHDLADEANICTNSGYMNLWWGELALSRRVLAQGRDVYERIAPGDRYATAGFAWLLSLTGEYDEAERIAAAARAHRSVPTRIVSMTALYEVADRRGDPDAADIAEELWSMSTGTGESQRSVPAQGARARQVLRTEGLDEALPLFWSSMSDTVNSRAQGSHWMFSPDLAAALAAERRQPELARWVDAVSELTRNDPNRHNRAAERLCVAHLLTLSGEPDAARRAFSEAAGEYMAMPCPARAVEARLGLADLEWDSGSVDTSLGAALLAQETAKAIGATALETLATRAVDRAALPPVLATVLFTDIVGSTEMAAAMGDRAWQGLLERHHAIVRRELARSRGREIDTAGDGFLVAFDTPAHAIRSACSIRDALAVAGIRIRAGLHTGECQESDGKLTGLTVHIAARVSQLAGAGEVLVSQTVRDLVTGSGLEFADRGSQVLKGVPGEWRLFAVVP